MNNMDNVKGYEKEYNEGALTNMLTKYAKVIGGDAICMALILKEILLDKGIPMVCKAPALACLGYTAAPVDAIPDAVPVAGVVDDTLALKGTLMALAMFVNENHKGKAINAVKGFLKLNDEEVKRIKAHIDVLL